MMQFVSLVAWILVQFGIGSSSSTIPLASSFDMGTCPIKAGDYEIAVLAGDASIATNAIMCLAVQHVINQGVFTIQNDVTTLFSAKFGEKIFGLCENPLPQLKASCTSLGSVFKKFVRIGNDGSIANIECTIGSQDGSCGNSMATAKEAASTDVRTVQQFYDLFLEHDHKELAINIIGDLMEQYFGNVAKTEMFLSKSGKFKHLYKMIQYMIDNVYNEEKWYSQSRQIKKFIVNEWIQTADWVYAADIMNILKTYFPNEQNRWILSQTTKFIETNKQLDGFVKHAEYFYKKSNGKVKQRDFIKYMNKYLDTMPDYNYKLEN